MKKLARVKYPETYYLHFKLEASALKNAVVGKKLVYPTDAVLAELDPHRKAAHAALDDLTVMAATFSELVKNIEWDPLKEFLSNEMADALECGYRCLTGDQFDRERLTDNHEGPHGLYEASSAVERLIEEYEEAFEEQEDKLAFLPLLTFWLQAIRGLCEMAAGQITGAGNLDIRMKARSAINQHVEDLF